MRNKKAFTLTELMIVVVIIAILTAIAVPVYSTYSENAKLKEFYSNHDIIISAVNMYAAAHNGTMPSQPSDLDRYLVKATTTASAENNLATYNGHPAGATYTMSKDSDGKMVIISKYKDITLINDKEEKS
jgi:prepilin-type N-terminal cleavage/methylation domain-containing protein